VPVSPQVSPLEFGLIGFLLILIWHVLNIGKQLFLASKKPASSFPCMADPAYPKKIQDLHDYMEDASHRIDRGEFSCRWNREEVRDLLEATTKQAEVSQRQAEAAQRQVSAIETLTNEIRLLRQEMVLTRNGRH